MSDTADTLPKAVSATVATAAGSPPPARRMCEHCALFNDGCPLDPGLEEVLTCVEFVPETSELQQAWELWLAAWTADRPSVFAALCALAIKTQSNSH